MPWNRHIRILHGCMVMLVRKMACYVQIDPNIEQFQLVRSLILVDYITSFRIDLPFNSIIFLQFSCYTLCTIYIYVCVDVFFCRCNDLKTELHRNENVVFIIQLSNVFIEYNVNDHLILNNTYCKPWWFPDRYSR